MLRMPTCDVLPSLGVAKNFVAFSETRARAPTQTRHAMPRDATNRSTAHTHKQRVASFAQVITTT